MSQTKSHEEHGTVRAYVIGFVLSLIFTVIPYYMVVNKTSTGDILLGAIVGIALLQMLIQIFFFLHLGRGPKPMYNVAFFGVTVLTIFVVVGGSIWIMHHLNYNMAPTEAATYLAEKEAIYQIDGAKTGACHGQHNNHRVTIENNKVSPVLIEAKQCDTLTFLNKDEQIRIMAFGSHPDHSGYAGEKELKVRTDRGKTITLTSTGTFKFHDHLDPNVNGIFTVESK